ncbi:MAG: NifB/NifX family molybdenum-iron cluster-binding protein [Nanoarchaeota archaeon]|nr:NifB/NifX family molybdenum-iron cluster-binding protein [Nanoarchaeota archaeon]
MKIAISATEKKLDGEVSEIFGRCPYFIIAEIKDKGFAILETIKNLSADKAGGAGLTAAQTVAEKGAEAVIAGDVGPKALEVLKQFNIKIYKMRGSIKEILENFKGKKNENSDSN